MVTAVELVDLVELRLMVMPVVAVQVDTPVMVVLVGSTALRERLLERVAGVVVETLLPHTGLAVVVVV